MVLTAIPNEMITQDLQPLLRPACPEQSGGARAELGHGSRLVTSEEVKGIVPPWNFGLNSCNLLKPKVS